MSRSGVYIPPHLRAQREAEAQAAAAAKAATAVPTTTTTTTNHAGASVLPSLNDDAALQRELWDALRRVLTACVNKVSAGNIEATAIETLRENVVRGRGLLCKALLRAQLANPDMAAVFACYVAVLNKELPAVGALLGRRLAIQWRRCYLRRDRRGATASALFLAHLVTQRVLSELLLLKLLSTYLAAPDRTADDIAVAVAILRESHRFLESANPPAFLLVMEPMRELLREEATAGPANASVGGGGGGVDRRSGALVEAFLDETRLWQQAKTSQAALPPELDLVEADDQVTHDVDIEDAETYDAENGLDNFRLDPNFEENEASYDEERLRILGEEPLDIAAVAAAAMDDAPSSDSDGEGESGNGGAPADAADTDERGGGAVARVATNSSAFAGASLQDGAVPFGDGVGTLSQEDLLKLRKDVFLLMRSSIRAEEIVHKLIKNLGPVLANNESVATSMILEACTHERMYNKIYALVAERLCKVNGRWQSFFLALFHDSYRRVDDATAKDIAMWARFFAHLLRSGAIAWGALSVIRLTEFTTTSSSRIFIAGLLAGLAEAMGATRLAAAFANPANGAAVAGLLPRDTPENSRFAVNILEQCGVGYLGDGLRKMLAESRKRQREGP